MPSPFASDSLPADSQQAYRRITQRLIEARREAKLRQVDLAGLLGKPQPYVSRYETGEQELTLSGYLDIAHAIGVDPVRLLADAMVDDGQ